MRLYQPQHFIKVDGPSGMAGERRLKECNAVTALVLNVGARAVR